MVSILMLMVPFPVQAAVKNVAVSVDNKKIEFDVKPYIDSQNRTIVPIRFISEELGYGVGWDQATKEVSVSGNGVNIKLWIGKKEALVNAKKVVLDTTAVSSNGRTMVPLRFVAENMGAKVEYNPTARMVSITRNQGAPDDDNKEPPPVNGKVAVVSGSVVNVRSGPGTSYSLVTQVKAGQALNILSQNGQWYEVAVASNGTGWIAGWLVAVREPVDQADRSPEPGEGREEPVDPDDFDEENLASVSEIKVDITEDELSFSVKGDKKLNYSSFNLDNPRRIVFDFYNSLFTGGENGIQEIAINQGLVKNIRVAQYTSDTVRIVLDLLEPAGVSLLSSQADGSLLTFKVEKPSLKGKVIVIDPGHGSIQPGGWSDPGAVGPTKLYERDVVLDIASKVAEQLKEKGAKVILTRTGDTSLTLAGRAEIANSNNADIFVSIHNNANTNRSIAGTSTYYYGAVNGQREVRKKLALAVQKELVNAIKRRDIGILEANFAVLRHTKVPSILVETAFISNYEEEKLLATPEFRSKAATGIVKGIERYFTE